MPLAPPDVEAEGRGGRRWPFGFGARALLALGAGMVWLIPAWSDRRALLVLVVWDALILVLWAFDVQRLPEASALTARRTWSGALGLGAPARVALAVRNPGAVWIDVQVVDTPSDPLRKDAPILETAVPPRGAARVGYDLTPRARGDAAIGDVVLRYQTVWGLAVRWAVIPLAQQVRVYPDLADARRHALSLVRSRQVAVEKRRARQRGQGREFESLRDYQEGDETRDICWTAAARRGRLVTRIYQPERSQAVWLVLDAGRLSNARIGQHARLDHAVNGALALAQVAMQAGDRVGLLAYARHARQRVTPGRGPLHLRLLVEALAAVRGEPVEGDHAAAAGALLSLQRRRALVVWLTEFTESAGVPDVIESGQCLAPRHAVLLAVPRATDVASLAGRRPATAEEMYRVMAAQETTERRESLLRSLRLRGVLVLEWTPGRLSGALVDRYLMVKERNLL